MSCFPPAPGYCSSTAEAGDGGPRGRTLDSVKNWQKLENPADAWLRVCGAFQILVSAGGELRQVIFPDGDSINHFQPISALDSGKPVA